MSIAIRTIHTVEYIPRESHELGELRALTEMLLDDMVAIYNSSKTPDEPRYTKEQFRAAMMKRLAARAGGN